MASIGTNSEDDDFSTSYSAYNETDSTTIGDASSFAVPSKVESKKSHSFANAKIVNHRVNHRKQQQQQQQQQKQLRAYSRDELLFALSSPSSMGAMAWIISSCLAVIYGSSVLVSLNFCIPLLVAPFVINQQMTAQLLPSVERKYNKIRDEANVLVMSNIQLKGTLSRLERQEYRLSVVEERFEHLCKRSDNDITKMKHLAKKNAALRRQIKATLAATKIQKLFEDILTPDYNGNCVINEKQICEIVMLMKAFAGKNTSSKFDKDTIHEVVVNSLASNRKLSLAPTSIEDTDSETMNTERECGDERRISDVEKDEPRDHSGEQLKEADSVQYSFEGRVSKSTKEEESWHVTNNDSKHMPLRLDPSGQLGMEPQGTEDFGGMVHTSESNGTTDEPIDIEKLLFSDQSHDDQRYLI